MLRTGSVFWTVFIFSASISLSQNVRYGVHAGLNLSGLTGIDKPQSAQKGSGFNGGLFLEARTGDYFSVWSELNYTQRKTSFEESISGINQSLMKITEANDYVELPFFLHIRKGDESLKTFLNLGGSVSVNTLKKRKSTVTIVGFPVDADTYYNYKVNPFDYGLSGGGGFQINSFYIEGRYYLSLCNLYGGKNYREMRYYTYNITVGYEINHPYIFHSSIRNVSIGQKIKHQWRVWFK
jgi:hypothetical protein